ncbi:hypothetical protein Cni_G23422 [Canna indica]|uniref:Phytocyanin domain-containing protein n=1 Tax=Canna indica TaxID=4628 RepID=A0AAQ3QMF6_9LILI|nr:hypothetical protein Cni_G23422 [Canna indica]
METCRRLTSFFLIGEVLIGLIGLAGAYQFYAGGRDGWVLNPSESYHDWSSRNRFQVNDTIVFRYKKGNDSVLLASKQDFDACNTSNPIARLDGGDSLFKFNRSGQFFFISGVPEKCRQGQKLQIVVMAARRNWPPPISVPPSLSPLPLPPAASPSSLPPSTANPPVGAPTAAGAASPTSSGSGQSPESKQPAEAASGGASALEKWRLTLELVVTIICSALTFV